MSSGVNPLEWISHGGFMMYPLLLSGFISLAVIIERVWLLQKKLKTPKTEVRKILEHVRAGQIQKMDRTITSPSPVLNVLGVAIGDLEAPLSDMELSMQNEAESWIPVLEKRLEVLDTIITAAPLMGLLGTITGMMGSFQVLSEKGVNEPTGITGGVAEALIATATGLVIALLTLVAYNYLNQVVKTMIFEMESVSSQVIEARKYALRKKV